MATVDNLLESIDTNICKLKNIVYANKLASLEEGELHKIISQLDNDVDEITSAIGENAENFYY